jgi:hypothetical protein
MINISASTLKDYMDCPKKVDFRLNYSGSGAQTTPQLMGTIVHYVIEKYWQNDRVALAEMRKQFTKYPELDNKERTKIELCIQNFFQLYGNILTVDDQIERFFKIPWGKDVQLVGKLDRIHNHVIYDWKTGAAPEDINRDPQFILYYLAYRKLFNRDPAAVSYVSLPTMKTYLFKPVPEYIDELLGIIPLVASQIKQKHFPKYGLFSYRTCINCAFQKPCWGHSDE